MLNCSRDDVILVRYPFSDLSSSKVRPAVVVGATHPSQDLLIVPLTSRTANMFPGEFTMADWREAGLNVPSTIKRGLYTVHASLVLKQVGRVTENDTRRIGASLRLWLAL